MAFGKFVVLAALCAASFAHAVTLNPSNADIILTIGGYHDGDFSQSTDPTTLSVSRQLKEIGDGINRYGRDEGPYVATASAAASIEAGILKAKGSVSQTGAASAVAGVFAQFDDSFVINGASDQSDLTVLLHYSISVSGSTQGSFLKSTPGNYGGSALAEWGMYHSITGSVQSTSLTLSSRHEVDTDNQVTETNYVNGVTGNPYGLFEFVVQTTVNRQNYVHTHISGNARAMNSYSLLPATVSASFDLGNSVYWGGISKITTLDGTPLDLTITSSSGMDYLKSYIPPVPEPSTWALLIAGLAVLPFARRKLH